MTRTIAVVFTLFTLNCSDPAGAQTLPETDIYLANLNHGVPGQAVRINISGGYNNQPHFSDDGDVIYYTRELPNPEMNSQTDIAAFHTGTLTTSMVSQSEESEYSPTPIPDRNALSVIRVEADQKQRLWAIDISSGKMELLLPDIEPVGYHAWINEREVAMFILGESFTLQTATVGKAGARLVADNIGRTLRRHYQNGRILFVDKSREPWHVNAFDSETGAIGSVLALFPDSEDFTVDSRGNYWTGNGSKLYRRGPTDSRWELVADLSAYGISNISRLAVSPENDKIALVSDHDSSNQ